MQILLLSTLQLGLIVAFLSVGIVSSSPRSISFSFRLDVVVTMLPRCLYLRRLLEFRMVLLYLALLFPDYALMFFSFHSKSFDVLLSIWNQFLCVIGYTVVVIMVACHRHCLLGNLLFRGTVVKLSYMLVVLVFENHEFFKCSALRFSFFSIFWYSSNVSNICSYEIVCMKISST